MLNRLFFRELGYRQVVGASLGFGVFGYWKERKSLSVKELRGLLCSLLYPDFVKSEGKGELCTCLVCFAGEKRYFHCGIKQK